MRVELPQRHLTKTAMQGEKRFERPDWFDSKSTKQTICCVSPEHEMKESVPTQLLLAPRAVEIVAHHSQQPFSAIGAYIQREGTIPSKELIICSAYGKPRNTMWSVVNKEHTAPAEGTSSTPSLAHTSHVAACCTCTNPHWLLLLLLSANQYRQS